MGTRSILAVLKNSGAQGDRDLEGVRESEREERELEGERDRDRDWDGDLERVGEGERALAAASLWGLRRGTGERDRENKRSRLTTVSF